MTARISPGQLFCLLSLFMLGSAWLFGLGAEAKQDAWLATIIGMAAGLPLMGVYLLLQRQFPRQTLVQYLPRILGKVLGKALALAYILYFLYIGARVTRDFAELLVLTILPRTPLSVTLLVLVALTAYGVRHGPEVLARVAQVLLPLSLGLVLLISAMSFGGFRTDRLLPVLEKGLGGVWKAAFPLTISVPFGETVLFAMIWPAVSRGRARWSLAAGAASGLVLTYLSLAYTGVLGAHVAGTSQFPLLQLVHEIRISGIFERPDAIVVLIMMVGGFTKIALFYYGTATGMAQWLGLADYRPLVLPVGAILLPLSVAIAGAYAEHVQIGLKQVPYTLHIPVQMVLPVAFLGIQLVKARLAR